MQTVLLDGVLIETTGAGAAAVGRLKAELVEATAKVAARDGEIDAIKRQHVSELAAVNAHSLDVDALDAAVASRIAVIAAAKAILGAEFDPAGKSDMAIRRFAAEQKLGEARLAGKDDAYVTIVFDTLVASAVSPDHAHTSGSAAVQPGYAIAAYNAQMGMHHKPDGGGFGHADVERAVRLSFGWVQRGLHAGNHHQSLF